MHTVTDQDLLSIQETRSLLRKSKLAQQELASFSQAQIDEICAAIVVAAVEHNDLLAKMANEETGFGNWQDKALKNYFSAYALWEKIKNIKTVGVIATDPREKTYDIAVPVGVVAGLIPSTNPTSTVIYKTLIAIKAGNSIVFSPHPNAKMSIIKTVEILQQAAENAGCPVGTISVITNPTLQGTTELMKHDITRLILATGGLAMVKAAYSSGTPAIGVGPGNGPAVIERTANIPLAVTQIIDSKTFDNGVICSSEQSVIVEKIKKAEVIAEFKKQGGYFLNKTEAKVLAQFMLRSDGSMNPQMVGKSIPALAKLTGLDLPTNTRVLIAEENRIGRRIPLSREKLTPILALYTTEDWVEALQRSNDLLRNGGLGHTMMIHTQDEAIVKEFGLQSLASRLLVNTGGSLGAVGGTTNLMPAMTLGCGAIGGSSTSDNIGPENLFNIRKVAYGVREMADLRRTDHEHILNKQTIKNNQVSLNDKEISQVVKAVLAKIL